MIIYVQVKTHSSIESVQKVAEGEYLARINALPQAGQANKRLIEVLADHFQISKTSISICSGKSSKYKKIEIL